MWLSQHASPIKSARWVAATNVLATGSWDKTIQYWNLSSPPTPVMKVALPERLYSMDVDGNLLVAATADRQVCIFDLRNPSTPVRVRSAVCPVGSAPCGQQD